MNHYVNQNTLDLFKTPNPKFLDVFPQEEQLFYLKVTRIMVSFFLNNICPLLTVKSKRMGKEKRIEHLRARRLLLTRLAANRVHWPRNVGYTYSEAILYSYRMYYKKRQLGLDTVYLSVDILICPLFQLLELKKYPKGNIRPPNFPLVVGNQVSGWSRLSPLLVGFSFRISYVYCADYKIILLWFDDGVLLEIDQAACHSRICWNLARYWLHWMKCSYGHDVNLDGGAVAQSWCG